MLGAPTLKVLRRALWRIAYDEDLPDQ
jgi:hypothetical protein